MDSNDFRLTHAQSALGMCRLIDKKDISGGAGLALTGCASCSYHEIKHQGSGKATHRGLRKTLMDYFFDIGCSR